MNTDRSMAVTAIIACLMGIGALVGWSIENGKVDRLESQVAVVTAQRDAAQNNLGLSSDTVKMLDAVRLDDETKLADANGRIARLTEANTRLQGQVLDLEAQPPDGVRALDPSTWPVDLCPPGKRPDPILAACVDIIEPTAPWTHADQAGFVHDLTWCIDNALYINIVGPGAGGVDPKDNVSACLQMMAESRARHP